MALSARGGHHRVFEIMKNIKYGTRFGCRFGQPHDFERIADTKYATIEKCKICQTKKRWRKKKDGRMDNKEYLIAHVRQFAQETGPTKRVFKKLYKPNECVIHI